MPLPVGVYVPVAETVSIVLVSGVSPTSKPVCWIETSLFVPLDISIIMFNGVKEHATATAVPVEVAAADWLLLPPRKVTVLVVPTSPVTKKNPAENPKSGKRKVDVLFGIVIDLANEDGGPTLTILLIAIMKSPIRKH
jgi:hypothetical protein